MNPLIHAAIGWLVGNLGRLGRRGRLACLLAGASPDVDGLPILYSWDKFMEIHHTFGHNVFFGLFISSLLSAATRERRAWPWALLAFLAHLVCDIIGTNWAVPLLWPLSKRGWTIWPSVSDRVIYGVIDPFVVVLVLFALLLVAARRERTPFESFWPRGHEALVRLGRKLFEAGR